jgi:hypothetical protein
MVYDKILWCFVKIREVRGSEICIGVLHKKSASIETAVSRLVRSQLFRKK